MADRGFDYTAAGVLALLSLTSDLPICECSESSNCPTSLNPSTEHVHQ